MVIITLGDKKVMSFLDSNANQKLQSLLEMSYDQFEGISTRWDELDFDIQNSVDFKNGFVFGKIEHKFTSWFYSENGRSMTDDEYNEFWKVLTDYAKKL